MDNLLGITSFVRTAELQSFVGAARALGLSPSAVGKNVAKLEAALDVRLLHRTTRRVRLTDEGALFLERCRRILDDLREAEIAVSDAGATPRGILRVSLPTIGYRFLVPHLPAFCAAYPHIELDLHCNDRLVDLLEEGMDVAIRGGELATSSLIARRLGSFSFVLCASPAYINAHGQPHSVDALATHDAVRFRHPGSGQLQPWPVELDRYPRTVLACSNMEGVRDATINGLGIAYMPDFLAADAVRTGGLCHLLEDEVRSEGQFSLVWPSGRLVSSRLRTFIDFATAHLFQDNVATP
ncbi:DNA-binding transcriptional LysR family regulator [Sphingomonas sp. SORGH_AS802]|uniref:LysR family transcriptional regulator n=1 Tax=unclassified Sphingomonas TaxID=196159 RepID=UPI002860B0B5|nr:MULTISPECIES: LysR family transcriptional regulator [unclassified Sphingomonas]MDR6126393.1 DNA-binding transcriptional LysR family regulator [Sphingomonas sp. SORGH_AS_0438]MDR6135762.1 DNA-binding transcriptional LysR family regulator [Sphingomonas sp. SORGH_AS_0802]